MKTVIADSGSTRTEWVFADENGVQTLSTAGINPVHMPAAEIESLLVKELHHPEEGVSAVYFYGAGCIPSRCGEVARVLRRFFGANEVAVESDLLGAARGLLGRSPGIACILGTGSNSGLYDGRAIVRNTRPLGYILGDEGSGADLGKRLLGNLLKGLLPDDLAEAFDKEYVLEYDEVIEKTYRQPGTNRFLAGFCPFLSQRIEHPAVRKIVEEAFSAFVERNLLAYEGVRELPVSFTGSVAFHFREPLRKVLADHGLTAGKIERSPMEGLIQYHKP